MASLNNHISYIEAIRKQVGNVVVGQDDVVERLLIALFTSGHILLQGMPGLAKTLLVNALGKAIHLDFSRIQFTIDLLPSDILGSQILDQTSGKFTTHKGPVFTNLLLADEINRAAPKVQGALLEAMQERKVTIGDNTYHLPIPFLVIATQNPIEQSGTFELPEAQLDRFMLCHRLEYPTPVEEEEILKRNLNLGIQKQDGGAVANTEFDIVSDKPVGEANDLISVIDAVHQIHVSDVFIKHVVELISRTRNNSHIELGASPRAGIALIKGARARALIQGRDYAIPDDLFALAEDVLLHRMRLNYEALADGMNASEVLDNILNNMG
jgi:MoxR-like ATPase